MAAKKKKSRSTKKIVAETEKKPFTLPEVTVPVYEDEDAWDKEGITARAALFIEHLLGPSGGCAYKAYMAAGYTQNRKAAEVGAVRILMKPNVQEAISRRIAKRRNNPDWVRDSLLEIAASSMANFLTVDEKGNTRLDFKKAAEAAAIGHIREFIEESHEIPDTEITVIKRRVKLHDRVGALTTLLKLMGELKDKVELTGADGKPIETTVTHTFDHDRFAELYRRRTGRAGTGSGLASPNGN